MAKSPAFQFYPKDFLSDINVQMMSDEDKGIYITMLCHDWLEDGLSDIQFNLLMKVGSHLVRDRFNQHPTKPGFWTNSRLLEEREKQSEWRKKSSDAGKKSGESRKIKALQNEPTLNQPSDLVEPKSNSPIASPIASASSINSTTLRISDLDALIQEQAIIAYQSAGLGIEDLKRGAQLVSRHWETNPKRKRQSDIYAGWVIQELLKEKTGIARLSKAKESGGYKPHTAANTADLNGKYLEEKYGKQELELFKDAAISSTAIGIEEKSSNERPSSRDVVVSSRRPNS